MTTEGRGDGGTGEDPFASLRMTTEERGGTGKANRNRAHCGRKRFTYRARHGRRYRDADAMNGARKMERGTVCAKNNSVKSDKNQP